MRVQRRPHPARIATALVIALALSAASSGTATSATGGSSVGVNVPSATSIAPGSCTAGTTATSFGSLLPGTPARTPAACTVQFGSSNDSSTLLLSQADRGGTAMFGVSFGAPATGWGGGTGTANWDAPGGPSDLEQITDATPDLASPGKVWVLLDESGNALVLARLDATGALDTTFSSGDGTDGYMRLSNNIRPEHSAIASLPDGRLLLATGETSLPDRGTHLARFNNDGSPDTTFNGGAGSVRVDLCNPNGSTNDEDVVAVRVDARGRIYVAGVCVVTLPNDAEWFVSRLTPEGVVDTTFGGDGTWELNADNLWNWLRDVVVDDAGSVYVTGWATCSTWHSVIAVAHITAAGNPDLAWDGAGAEWCGGNGFVGYEYGPNANRGWGIALDGTGRVVVAGQVDPTWSGGSNTDTVVARFTSTGALDTTFSGDGLQVHDFSPGAQDEAMGVWSSPGGQIVLAGTRDVGGGDTAAFTARLTQSGALESRYGTAGVATHNVTVGRADTTDGMSIGLDGRLLVRATTSVTASDSEAALVQYAAPTISDYANLGGGGDRDWSSGASTSMLGVCLAALGGGATAAAMTVDPGGDCATTDADAWYPIAATPGTSARVAQGVALQETTSATLWFGMRAASNTPADAYLAPITFGVVAPAV